MEVYPASADKYTYSFFFLLFPTLLLCILVPIILIRRARLRLPPGPRGLPVIGHLHMLGSNPHHSLCELSRRYGPLMYLRFGSVPVVVASSPSTAKLILQTHDHIFAWRSQQSVPMQLHGCTDILFSQPGPYWRLIRKICVSDLFGNKRLESFRPLAAEETCTLLHSILNMGEKVPVRTKLYDCTCNIISRMAISKRLDEVATHSQTDPSNSLVALLLEIIHLLGIFNVGDFIPLLAWMDLQGCVRRSKIVRQKITAVWQGVIDARRNSRILGDYGNQDVDFLDVLLSASKGKDIQITDLNIMAILTDMFGAGIDTSTVSMEWALAELLTHPFTMKKVQDELEEVVGPSRLVEESDIGHLPYLRAVVKETMRLHPVLPLLVPHMASQHCQISEYDIPSNTQAYVNVWAINRDPIVWDRPLEFCPERFLGSNMDVRGQHFELLPFGSGRRACPGMNLGLNSVHLMLASLLHAFDWTVSGAVDMSEKFGIVMTLANPLVANASPRVPRHLIPAC